MSFHIGDYYFVVDTGTLIAFVVVVAMAVIVAAFLKIRYMAR